VVDRFSSCGLRQTRRISFAGLEAERVVRIGIATFERALTACPGSAHTFLVTIGARRSALALAQVREAEDFMRLIMPHARFTLATMDTPGDRDRVTPLPDVTDEDFFTRDLDKALLDGQIDMAVHSAKDLQPHLPTGLVLGAMLPSFAPWECLVACDAGSLAALPAGAVVGTSSARRREWLKTTRADLVPREIRGNVPDRLAQLEAGEYDALILAAAGLIRLGWANRITQVFGIDEFPPTAGQGSLALVVRTDDRLLREALMPLDIREHIEERRASR